MLSAVGFFFKISFVLLASFSSLCIYFDIYCKAEGLCGPPIRTERVKLKEVSEMKEINSNLLSRVCGVGIRDSDRKCTPPCCQSTSMPGVGTVSFDRALGPDVRKNIPRVFL